MPGKGPRSNTAGGGVRRRYSFFDKPDSSSLNDENEAEAGWEELNAQNDRKTDDLFLRSAADPSVTLQARSATNVTGADNSTPLDSEDVLRVPKGRRFSMLKLRHASDPQLSKSYALSAPTTTPPLPHPPTPTIVTTAPNAPPSTRNGRLKDKLKLPGRSPTLIKENLPIHNPSSQTDPSRASESNARPHQSCLTETAANQRVTFETPGRFSTPFARGSPPAYGDVSNTSLALPPPRLSESSRSDASSGEHPIYAETTTTHTVSTTTTFFRLPRRKKDKGHLFPLPVKIPPPGSGGDTTRAPTPSSAGRKSLSPGRQSPHARQPATAVYAPELRPNSSSERPSPLSSPRHSAVSLASAAPGSPGISLYRSGSVTSYRSANSTMPASMPPPSLASRGRSSTVTSSKRHQERERQDSPQLLPAGRTSTSTTGRKSFGDMFSFSQRFRQNSEPGHINNGKLSSGAPGTPASTNSKSNSFQMHREPLAYPERADDDTPASYLAKLEEAVNRGVIAAILCQRSDDFFKTCLRKYMRGFLYFGDSIDMAVRKMLMEVELPKETQQIDRLLQGFADRYCECNPGIFASTDEAYFVAFSILLLHSDTHNKNNKRKMQKADYVKNTQDQVEVSHDILGCFYDNVSYTPFIHFEDDVATSSHRMAAPKPKRGLFKTPSVDNLRGPVDPYALILDQKLELLRPPLKDVMDTEDTYNCTGTASSMNTNSLHETFHRASVLQIVSARSRPDAFLSQATISNPSEAQVGLVDIKAAKVGLLWRKDPKKKKTRSPWQEWGALLTGSQLYFFRDVGWVKSLMSQHDAHQKSNLGAGAVVFKPPLASFQPDALISMDDAIALLDVSYKKHKHAFLFVKHGGFEEVFLANSEDDMNDWIAKLNYAATFRTAGVRMRGFTGADYGRPRPEVGRHASATSAKSLRSDLGDSRSNGRQINQQLTGEILAYRHQVMNERVAEANDRLATTQKELDNLLRNARHLQICSPIQAKSRETLVLAAGRMSAKLKWTRVEMWRTRGHRDILKMDLEQDIANNFVAPSFRESSSARSTPRKKSQPKSINQTSKRPEPKPVELAASPISTQSFLSSASVVHSSADTAKVNGSIPPASSHGDRYHNDGHLSTPSIEPSPGTDGVAAEARDPTESDSFQDMTAWPLTHQHSISSAVLKRGDADSLGRGSGIATPGPSIDGEERWLREAGLLDVDPSAPHAWRWPESNEPEVDFNTVTSPDMPSKDRAGVRRSLQRTLRDAPHSPQGSQSLRQRKGKEGAVPVSPAASMRRSSHSGTEGLARKAGRFTVHGKKASVVTISSEWQSMTPEERIKLRKPERSGKGEPVQGEAGEADEEISPEAGVKFDEANELISKHKDQNVDGGPYDESFEAETDVKERPNDGAADQDIPDEDDRSSDDTADTLSKNESNAANTVQDRHPHTHPSHRHLATSSSGLDSHSSSSAQPVHG